MAATTRCDNPMCTCDPCVCDSCSCGAARLGELERKVMDVLWQLPEREWSVRDVVHALPEYAYTTLATILDRLPLPPGFGEGTATNGRAAGNRAPRT